MRYNLEDLIREDRPQLRPQSSALVVQPLSRSQFSPRGYREGCEPTTLGNHGSLGTLGDWNIGGMSIVQVAGILALGFIGYTAFKKARRVIGKARRERRESEGRRKARIMLDAQEKIAGSGGGPSNLTLLVGAAVVGGLAWFAYRQHQAYRALTPGGQV